MRLDNDRVGGGIGQGMALRFIRHEMLQGQ